MSCGETTAKALKNELAISVTTQPGPDPTHTHTQTHKATQTWFAFTSKDHDTICHLNSEESVLMELRRRVISGLGGWFWRRLGVGVLSQPRPEPRMRSGRGTHWGRSHEVRMGGLGQDEGMVE